jgi:hypothetical protein
MPDSHRLPFYALAGTQDAITLTQLITLRDNKSHNCGALSSSPRIFKIAKLSTNHPGSTRWNAMSRPSH